MTILITILIIAVLILVHEWGHFFTARRIGIPVHEFSIGFGYQLFSIKKNGVVYSLRLLPLGGYVRMAGEEPGDQEDPNGFSNRTPLEKIRVAFAGPFMNFVLAVFIFIYIYTFIGVPHNADEPVIGRVVSGQPADRAGIQAGDIILSVNGESINSWTEFTGKLADNPEGQVLEIKAMRNEIIESFTLTPEKSDTAETPIIGVAGKVEYEKQGIVNSIKIGFQQTYQLTALLLSGLWMMISGGVSMNDVAGPAGIVQLVGEAAQFGGVFLLSFSAFLSINLGILNLLPIPALDGSRIVFAIVEAIRRKPLEPEKEGFVHWIGFLFLIGLMLLVTYNDIIRLIRG